MNAFHEMSYNKKVKMARDRSTYPDFLDLLANQKNEYIQLLVAKNPSTHPSTLSKLIGKSHEIDVNLSKRRDLRFEDVQKLLIKANQSDNRYYFYEILHNTEYILSKKSFACQEHNTSILDTIIDSILKGKFPAIGNHETIWGENIIWRLCRYNLLSKLNYDKIKDKIDILYRAHSDHFSKQEHDDCIINGTAKQCASLIMRSRKYLTEQDIEIIYHRYPNDDHVNGWIARSEIASIKLLKRLKSHNEKWISGLANLNILKRKGLTNFC